MLVLHQSALCCLSQDGVSLQYWAVVIEALIFYSFNSQVAPWGGSCVVFQFPELPLAVTECFVTAPLMQVFGTDTHYT